MITKQQKLKELSHQLLLENAQKETDIFYTLNDSAYIKYEKPFSISEALTLRVYSEKEDEKSATIATEFYKINPNRSLVLKTKYASQYSAGGPNALIDGIKGSKDFRSGPWQGYEDQDVIAIVALEDDEPVHSITVNFLQDQRSFIFYPTEVQCYTSSDNKNFQLVGKQSINAVQRSDDKKTTSITFNLKDTKTTYVKLVAKKLGKLPKWHSGYQSNGKSWIFVDEICIE